MSSLSHHLIAEAGHASLRYHPECPICRTDRLAGSPPATAVLGPRGRALVLAATLGFAASSTMTAIAFPTVASADEEFEGPAGGFSPEELQQIQQTPQAETLPPSAEAPEPPDEADDPHVEEGTGPPAPPSPGGQAPPSGDQAQPAVQQAPPSGDQAPPAVQQAPAGPPPVRAQPQGPPAPPPPAPRDGRPAKPKSEREPVSTPRRGPEPVATPRPQPEPIVTGPRDPVPVAAPPRKPAPVPTPAGGPASASTSGPERGAKDVHLVARGESLWSIAAKRLGPGASPAEVAREVNRIWNLNASSIRSGRPDLIMVGERLRMS